MNEPNQTPEEKWEQATIANNFIFYKVMRNNPDVCKELLEILLKIEIDHIDMRCEETIETDFGSKGIRLDVYAKTKQKHSILRCKPPTQKNYQRGQGTIKVR